MQVEIRVSQEIYEANIPKFSSLISQHLEAVYSMASGRVIMAKIGHDLKMSPLRKEVQNALDRILSPVKQNPARNQISASVTLRTVVY